MGSSASKYKRKKKRCYLSPHCCMKDCFESIPDISDLKYVFNINWYFTKTHQEALESVLSDKQLLNVVAIIIQFLQFQSDSFLENNADSNSNYRAFIRTGKSLFASNIGICETWFNSNSSDHEKEINMMLLGAVNVGKSSIYWAFMESVKEEDEYDPTIEDNYRMKYILNVNREDIHKSHTEIYLKYENKPKQRISASILYSQYDQSQLSHYEYNTRASSVFILVFSISDSNSFKAMKEYYYPNLLRIKQPEWKPNGIHDKTNFGVIVVGNKCDLRGSIDDKVDMNEVYKWLKETQLPYIETSVKEKRNINFLFRHCIFEYWIQSHSGCMPYCK